MNSVPVAPYMPNGLRTYRPSLDHYSFCNPAVASQTRSWLAGVMDGTASRSLMLSGGTGLGKTTLAKALARKLKIVESEIYETNCANTRTLEDARSLVENLQYAPRTGTFRVLLLDEVHQMVPNAQQVFLTPLESLASQSLVMACTSDPSKLLPAFRNRFYEIKLSDYTEEGILEILDQLPISLDANVKALIAQRSGGNVRRAIDWVEKTLSGQIDITNPDAVRETLRRETEPADQFFTGIVQGNWKQAAVATQLVTEETRRVFFERLTFLFETSWALGESLQAVIPGKQDRDFLTQFNFPQMAVTARASIFGRYWHVQQLADLPLRHLRAWAMAAGPVIR